MEPRADAGPRRRTPRRGRAQAGRRASALILSALAPAKINLFLHVGPVRADGYHPLESLVAFADVGDVVTATPAERLSLTVTGPFAEGLGPDGDNLVLRALRALGEAAGVGEPGLAVTLDKRLPIAAGLGGGSSDAGAALRLANRALGLDWPEDRLETVSRVVGADGPMCLRARAAWAGGVGEMLEDAPRLPTLHAVLVNPRRPSPTGAVYRAYDAGFQGTADRPQAPESWDATSVTDWLETTRNDLETPAVALEPAIGEVLSALAATEARMVRMSGSGATAFALFETSEDARRAADHLKSQYAGWWVQQAVLNGSA